MWFIKNWRLVLTGVGFALLIGALTFSQMDLRHFKKLYENEHTAHQLTVANFQKATAEAKTKDTENVLRVKTEQDKVTEEVSNDYEKALADARTRADALRVQLAARAHSSSSGTATVPAISNSASGPDATTEEARFSAEDRLIATEQALQLDALQKWVTAQGKIDVNGDVK